MADQAAFPIVLAVVSLGFAVMSVYHVEKKDLN